MVAGAGAQARMTVVEGTSALDRSVGRVVAVVGVFDGLHRGHEYLLGELRRVAAADRARPMVITFDHHPDEILKGAAPPLLCDPDERLERLSGAGVAVTVIETFDRALRETPYDVWVRGIADRVELAGFVMTPESAFGYNRGGNPETVAALGSDLGFQVAVVPQFTLAGQPVRSSDIRAAIAAGDLATAERLLGRPYSVIGAAGERDADAAAAEIRFPLPIALPPAGTYGVRLEAGDASRETSATISNDLVAVAAHSVEPGMPVRLTFIGDPAAVSAVGPAGPQRDEVDA